MGMMWMPSSRMNWVNSTPFLHGRKRRVGPLPPLPPTLSTPLPPAPPTPTP